MNRELTSSDATVKNDGVVPYYRQIKASGPEKTTMLF